MTTVSDLIDTTEMYLRTIYELVEEDIVPLRARIAERLHQSGPTVSQTVARMERDGLLTVEGENDDISGVGQTKAALDLTPNLPDSRKAYHLQEKVGHYGVFNGSRYRAVIAPRIAAFIREMAANPV